MVTDYDEPAVKDEAQIAISKTLIGIGKKARFYRAFGFLIPEENNINDTKEILGFPEEHCVPA
jgi:hypothetical protein